MKKIIKIVKTNKLFILGIALGVGISSVSVYTAANIITSKRVGYTNTQSHLTADNVQDAIDELYTHARNYQSLKADILDTVYPVGSIYISTSLSTTSQVAAKLGGTWQVFGDGRVLRGTTGTAGSTGGSDTVTLQAANLPSHTHSMAHVHSMSHSHTMAHTHTFAHTHGVPGVSHNHGTSSMSAAIGSGSSNAYSLGFIAVSAAGGNSTYTIGSNTYQASGHPGRSHNTKIVGTTDNATPAATTTNSQSTTTTGASSASSTGTYTGNTGGVNTSVSSTAANTGSTGSGTAFSVQDPYITVYMYKRTA